MPLNEEGFISRVSIRHSVSADAVRTILRALRSGGGSMAQFSHPRLRWNITVVARHDDGRRHVQRCSEIQT